MLSGAVLYAKDLDQLTKFYVALGGQIVDREDGEFSIIGGHETELTIVQAPPHIAAGIVIEEPPVPRSETPLKPVIHVRSLKDAAQALSACGGRIQPGSGQWVFRNMLIQDVVDPEGNIAQLRQPV